MNKSQAEDAATRMAEGHAAKASDPEAASKAMSKVNRAVYDHLREMVPEAVVFTVLNRQDQPKVIAIAGTRLYELTVVDLPEGLEPASTQLRVRNIDPMTATVDCEVKFAGHRMDDRQVIRETIWRFRVQDIELTIETFVDRSRDWIEDDEEFASALATTIGWEEVSEASGPLVAVARR